MYQHLQIWKLFDKYKVQDHIQFLLLPDRGVGRGTEPSKDPFKVIDCFCIRDFFLWSLVSLTWIAP